MKTLFQKIFNLYPGEGRRAFLFSLLGFTWSLAVNLAVQYSEALFLVNIGANRLPFVYILSALGMIVPVIAFLKTVNRCPPHKIFLTIIAILALFYSGVFIALLLGANEIPLFWYIIRIIGFQLWAVMVTGFWTFTDQYHNMQDSKRLYVLFSSTIFCGLALTGLTMRLGAISFQWIIFGVVILALLSTYLVNKIVNDLHIAYDDTSQEGDPSGKEVSIKATLKQMLNSPFSLLIMASNFFIFIMWISAEYNYLSAFDKIFDPETVVVTGTGVQAPLTLFLGQCVTAVSLSNLIFGLFFYSRTIRRFGLGALLLFSPALLIVAFLGWIRYEALFFMVMAYFVVEGSLEVIDDSNFNLLLNAIPKRLKYKVRVTIESLLEPAGMLIAGLLLSFPVIDSRYLTLFCAIAVLIIAIFIRTRYHSAVYINLAEKAIHFERRLPSWFTLMPARKREKELFRLYEYVGSETPRDSILAIEGILKLGDRSQLSRLLARARSYPDGVKKQFLELLEQTNFSHNKIVSCELQQWLTDEGNDKNCQNKLLYILAKQGLLHPENIPAAVDASDLNLRAAALLAYKKGWAHLPAHVVAKHSKIADEEIARQLKSDKQQEILMGLKLIGDAGTFQQIDTLLPFLDHPLTEVTLAAMQSIAKLASKHGRHYAKTLIYYLRKSKSSAFRQATLGALGKFDDASLIRDIIIASEHFHTSEWRKVEEIMSNMGERSVPKLLAITKDVTIPHRCRALSGRILGHLALPYLHANLYDVIMVEIDRAYFYFYHHHRIQSSYPDLSLGLLTDALQTGFHTTIEFIIHILSTAGEIEDSALICRLFRSGDVKLRSQVIETLERTCDRKIFNALRPLLEEISTEHLVDHYLKSSSHCLSLQELIELMSRSSSQVDQIVAATLYKELQLPDWKSAIQKQSKRNKNEIFQHLARELLEL